MSCLFVPSFSSSTSSSPPLFLSLSSAVDSSVCVFHPPSLSQRLVLPDHLSVVRVVTALEAHVLTTEQGKEIKNKGVEEMTIVVVGTESGEIILWNAQSGEVMQKVKAGGMGHTKKVTSVAFHPGQQSFYSAAADKSVIRWGFQGELIHKWSNLEFVPSCVVVSPDGENLVVASSEIHLWDTSSKAKKFEYTGGHASNITILAFSADSQFLFSGDADRFVSVWSQSSKTAIQVINLNFSPISIILQGEHACFIGKEAINVFSLSFKKSAKKVKVKTSELCNIQLDKSASNGASFLAAFLNESNCTLQIASGAPSFPQFDTINFLETKSLEIKLKKADSNGKKKAKLNNESNIVVIADSNGTVTKSLLPLQVTAKVSSKKSVNELTLEEKLALSQVEKVLVTENVVQVKNGKNLTSQPQADSLYTVLTQALHANDNTMLDFCLSTTDAKLIQQTVDRLSLDILKLFFARTLDKYQAAPARAISLSLWVQSILTFHSRAIIEDAHLYQLLVKFYQSIETRVGAFRKLLKLSGRLDLLLSHVSASDTKNRGIISNSNAFVYDESVVATKPIKILGKRSPNSLKEVEMKHAVQVGDSDNDEQKIAEESIDLEEEDEE